MVITGEFYTNEYGLSSYERVLEVKVREITTQEEMITQELKEAKGIEAMERGGGAEGNKEGGEESEDGGLVRGVVGGVWGITKGAARIALLPVVLPVRATVGTVKLLGSAVSVLRGQDVEDEAEGEEGALGLQIISFTNVGQSCFGISVPRV
jgi:hypothetical protein